MKRIRVVTLNLLYDDWKRWERLELAVAEIRRLDPDIVLLQEVDLAAEVDKKLKECLPKYHLSLCARPGNASNNAQAALSKIKPDSEDRKELSQNRVAQKLTFDFSGKTINFINVHLYFNPFRDVPRQRQVREVLGFAGNHSVIAGDFNALPRSKSIKKMKKHFTDAHNSTISPLTSKTYPTPLWRGPGMRHSLRSKALNFVEQATNARREGWGGVIDYIFVDNNIQVLDCRVVFNASSSLDSNLYASDHYGLVADLAI